MALNKYSSSRRFTKTTTGEETEGNKYVLNKTKKSGKLKHKEISKNRFDRMEKRYKKQSGSRELGSDTSIGQQVISGRGDKSVSRRGE